MGCLYTKSHENSCSVASNSKDSEAHIELRAQIPHSLEARIEGVKTDLLQGQVTEDITSTAFPHIPPTERLSGQQPASEFLLVNESASSELVIDNLVTGTLSDASPIMEIMNPESSNTVTTKADTVPASPMMKSMDTVPADPNRPKPTAERISTLKKRKKKKPTPPATEVREVRHQYSRGMFFHTS